MSKLLVIGCGGVASVAIQKCCQNHETFPELCIASRTVSKCDALKAKLEAAGTPVKITTTTVNADDVEDIKRVITAYGPDLVLNVADRKSTRLNSSHVSISYAVFCLKKK